MDNQTLMFLMAGGLLYLVFTKKGTGELYFNVPGVGNVPESALPGMGYIKMQGQWFHQSAVNQAAINAGGTPGQTITEGTVIFNSIMTILQAGFGLYTQITTITAANRAQAIQQILDKYTSPSSPNFVPAFLYTQSILETKTNAELKQILDFGYL